MEEDRQILNEFVDHPLASQPLPPTQRKKASSRVYHGVVAFAMFLFLLLCAIALGSFGEFQRQLSGFYTLGDFYYLRKDLCILYATTKSEGGPNVRIEYNSFAPCIFMFWGLVSGIILSFTLLAYSIVMIIIGPRILSCLRVLDFVVCFLGFLAFFAFSITITAGLNRTCSGFVSNGGNCAGGRLLNFMGDELPFYNAIESAQNCCWIITIMLLGFSIWNLVLIIFFVKKKKKSRQTTINDSANVYTAEPPLPSQKNDPPPPYSTEPSAPLEQSFDSPFSGQTNPYTQ